MHRMSSPKPKKSWKDRGKSFLLNVLVGFALISLYGQYHYLLPWHKPLTHPTFTEKLFGDYDHE